MKSKKNGSVYRPILWRALKTTWNHKELWIFAFFAGLAGTGVVVNDVIQQAHIAFQPSAHDLNAISNNIISFLQDYLRLVVLSGKNHVLWAAIGSLALIIGSGFIITLCQQMLLAALHRAAHKHQPLTNRELLHTLHHHHFLRILGVDLLFHVLIFLVLGGGGLLIRELPLSIPAGGATALLLAAAILFAAFILNIIAMLTLIAVGQEHVSVTQGLQEGVARFLRHPLVACEIAMLLFATNLLFTLLYLLSLTLLALPFGLLFAEMLVAHSYVGILTLTTVGSILAVLLTVFSAGFMVTFTYATWTFLNEYLNRAPFIARVHHYTRRLFKKTTLHAR